MRPNSAIERSASGRLPSPGRRYEPWIGNKCNAEDCEPCFPLICAPGTRPELDVRKEQPTTAMILRLFFRQGRVQSSSLPISIAANIPSKLKTGIRPFLLK